MIPRIQKFKVKEYGSGCIKPLPKLVAIGIGQLGNILPNPPIPLLVLTLIKMLLFRVSTQISEMAHQREFWQYGWNSCLLLFEIDQG